MYMYVYKNKWTFSTKTILTKHLTRLFQAECPNVRNYLFCSFSFSCDFLLFFRDFPLSFQVHCCSSGATGFHQTCAQSLGVGGFFLCGQFPSHCIRFLWTYGQNRSGLWEPSANDWQYPSPLPIVCTGRQGRVAVRYRVWNRIPWSGVLSVELCLSDWTPLWTLAEKKKKCK